MIAKKVVHTPETRSSTERKNRSALTPEQNPEELVIVFVLDGRRTPTDTDRQREDKFRV